MVAEVVRFCICLEGKDNGFADGLGLEVKETRVKDPKGFRPEELERWYMEDCRRRGFGQKFEMPIRHPTDMWNEQLDIQVWSSGKRSSKDSN